jgi:MerR family copper efflux transcriptional regulator
MTTMTIGGLAKQAGVNIDTIRYYERNGLIPEPARRPSGYREYAATDVERLRFILRAKDLSGSGSQRSASRCRFRPIAKGVKMRAASRLKQVERKI